MTLLMLGGWAALIFISYKLSVAMLEKAAKI